MSNQKQISIKKKNPFHESSCIVCQDTPSPQKKIFDKFPSFLSFIIVFIPKCPFCFVAYSSAMTMCGGPSLITHHSDWGAWLALGLGGIVIFCIALNNRGVGTYRALSLALFGFCLVVFGITKPDMMICYYIGAILLLLAAFYNGSGFRWLNKFFLKTSKQLVISLLGNENK
jgi:hypothetical protein